MGTAAYVALLAQEEEAVQKLQNKRHGEPALIATVNKQRNKPKTAPHQTSVIAHKPNLITRMLKVFSNGRGLFFVLNMHEILNY